MKFQAAIFDMDGLLLDTETISLAVFEQACDTVGIPFLKSVYLSAIGQNAAGIEQTIRAGYGAGINYPQLLQECRQRYDAIVHHQPVPVKKGAIELLQWLKANNIPRAVATSTAKHNAFLKLQLAGIDVYFDAIATGCEVKNGKPDPEIYLLAAQRLNTAPEQCIAFEDSNNGVRAAVSAKMITFQVPDLVQPSDDVLALGHSVVTSLHQVLPLLQNQIR